MKRSGQPEASVPEGTVRLRTICAPPEAHAPGAPGRWLSLFLFALGFLPCPATLAHDLQGQVRVLPQWQIEVEAWFDSGDVPWQARVEAYRPDGSLAAQGRLDRRGIFAFRYLGAEPLRVVVSAGAGHRQELAVTAEMLHRERVPAAILCLAPPPNWYPAAVLTAAPASEPGKEAAVPPQRPGPPLGKLALGVALLLIVAGAVLVLRQAKQGRAARGRDA